MCSGRAQDLKEFKREVFSYRFQDKPDYKKLVSMLEELREERQVELGESDKT